MIAGVESPGTPPTPQPAGQVIHRATSAALINFDDALQPCLFLNTTRLTTAYAGLGVTFEGPGGLDGGAIVDQCGNWGATGYSPPNFLGFNVVGVCADGGVPRTPETLHFSPPVSQVSMLAALGAGSDPGSVTIEAYNASDVLVSGQSIVAQPFVQLLSVSGPGIVRVVINGPSAFLVDDLAYDYGVVPTVSASWGRLKTIYR